MAVVFAVLFVCGGLVGWWRIEGRTTTGSWEEVTPSGEYLDGHALPGDSGVDLGMTVLLPCVAAWVWAPFGGHIGRLATLAAFAFAIATMTQFPAPRADGAMPDAVLGQDGWEWHGLDGTRPIGLSGVESGMVELRERVQPGATLSLASAVGGLAVAGLSMVRSAFARRGGPRRRDDPPGPNEFDAQASRVYEGFTYHRTDYVDRVGHRARES